MKQLGELQLPSEWDANSSPEQGYPWPALCHWYSCTHSYTLVEEILTGLTHCAYTKLTIQFILF